MASICKQKPKSVAFRGPTHILKGGAAIFTQDTPNGGQAPFNLTLTLAKGERIDFVVNRKANPTYDSTTFSASINFSAIPRKQPWTWSNCVEPLVARLASRAFRRPVRAAELALGAPASVERLKQMNRVQVGLLADLLEKLKTANLLKETLVLYGSDMSDGNVHLSENLPMLLCGDGADLRFGQEIVPAARRPLSDLHLEIFGLLGVTSVTSFGSGVCKNTGQPLGIRV